MSKGDPRYLLITIAKILNHLNIPYFISGGMAVLVWGRPRFTADIDIIVELKKEYLDQLEKALRRLGKTGYLDRGTMEWALAHQGEFNFIEGETGLKVDFWVAKDDSFDRSRFKRRVPRKILNQTVYFTSPEDLILIKLLWHKDSRAGRQLEDIESVLKISDDQLDKNYLTKWAQRLGVSEILSSFWQANT